MKKTKDEKYKDILKDSEIAEELAEIKDYLHKHTTKAFMELALGAFADGQMHDSNYSLALLAQESKYDVISCLFVSDRKSNVDFSACEWRRYNALNPCDRLFGRIKVRAEQLCSARIF